MTDKQQDAVPSRWEILARERNARVVLCHTPDTYTLTELTRSADRAMRALRDRTFTTLAIEDVTPLFEEYNQTLIGLHQIIRKISNLVDIRYKTPRMIARMVDNKEDKADDAEVTDDPEGADEDEESNIRGKTATLRQT
jgi:hypothetical protein